LEVEAREQASKGGSDFGEPVMPDHVAITRAMRLALDKASVEQHFYVLRNGGLGEGQRLGDIATAAFTLLLARKEPQDIEPNWMTQGSHDVGDVVVVHGGPAELIGELR
jgi:hypothetical protein